MFPLLIMQSFYMQVFALLLNSAFSIFICHVDIMLLNCNQIELATGQHPYSQWKTVFEQMKEVIEGKSPQLPVDQFSEDFHDFVNCW